MFIENISNEGEILHENSITTVIKTAETHHAGDVGKGYVFLDTNLTPLMHEARVIVSGIVSVRCISDTNVGDTLYYDKVSGHVTNEKDIDTIKCGIAMSKCNFGEYIAMYLDFEENYIANMDNSLDIPLNNPYPYMGTVIGKINNIEKYSVGDFIIDHNAVKLGNDTVLFHGIIKVNCEDNVKESGQRVYVKPNKIGVVTGNNSGKRAEVGHTVSVPKNGMVYIYLNWYSGYEWKE